MQISPWLLRQCLATISTVYWKSNEESVEGEKIQKAPMLESRRAVSSDTRADRVQGKYTRYSTTIGGAALLRLRARFFMAQISRCRFPRPSPLCAMCQWRTAYTAETEKAPLTVIPFVLFFFFRV